MSGFFVFVAAAFALVPGLAVFLASLTAGNALAFPPDGLSLKWYRLLFTNSDFLSALSMSTALAVVTGILAVVIAIPASIAIVRHKVPGATMVEGLLLSPLAVPHLVIGIAVLKFYNETGIRGGLVSVVVGHLLITIPFVLRMLVASLSGLALEIEHAASSLGARRAAVLFTIVLPQMKMGIIGALVAAFVLSFDDLTVTVFLVQPGYSTLPVLLFNQAENAPLPSIHAASVVLLLASGVGVLIIERLIGLERLFLGGRRQE